MKLIRLILKRVRQALALSVLVGSPAFATWTSVGNPTYTFNTAGTAVTAVHLCGVDSVLGTVCAEINKDSNGAPLAMTGPGDLQNQPAVQQALKTALINERTAELAAQTAATTAATNSGKITLTPPAGVTGS